MSFYHFRVHIDNLCLEKLVGFIKSNATTLIIVKEVGERPHIHCILTPIKTISTFRQNFLKNFEMCKGNKCYSLEEVKDIEHMKAYVCKGEKKTPPEVIYSSDTIDTGFYHHSYWEVNALLVSKVSERKQTKNKTNKGWLHEVREEFLTQYPECYRELGNPYTCRWKTDKGDAEEKIYDNAGETLLEFMYKKYGKVVKMIDDSIVTKHYRTIENCAITDYDAENASVLKNYVKHKYFKLIKT